jgi:hypothetical protein
MSKVTANRRVAPWLWRAANGGLVLALAGIGTLAAVLALGAADPPRAGPLVWEDDFKAGLGRWVWEASPGSRVTAAAGALEMELTGAESAAWAVTAVPTGSLTVEVAGAAAAGSAPYGLVFDWQDSDHYSAVLVNGNGYAEAYTQTGAARATWLAWQQWPHILYGAESNRVRVDLRPAEMGGWNVTARINDELLAETKLAGGAGQVGVLARGAGPARMVFSWVRVWAPR